MEDLVFGKPIPAGVPFRLPVRVDYPGMKYLVDEEGQVVGLRGPRPALEQILADMARLVRELDLHGGSGGGNRPSSGRLPPARVAQELSGEQEEETPCDPPFPRSGRSSQVLLPSYAKHSGSALKIHGLLGGHQVLVVRPLPKAARDQG